MTVPGMLYGAVLFSPTPRGRFLRIDTARASQMPGVHAVVTAKDVSGERYQGLITKDWPQFVAEGEETRCVGDILAAVAAESDKIARAAAAEIQIDYEELPPITDPHDALKDDSAKIHPDGNLLSRSVVKRGSVEDAFANSSHVASHTFQTQMVEHAFLEPESCLAVPEDGGIEIYSQGQGVFDDRIQIASVLGLPEEKVHVTLVPNGGAFGGKEDLSIQGQTALLAMVTGRPVKMTLSREESIRFHAKRHPIEMHYKVGCDAEGHLTAVYARMIGDKGAYASVGAKVLERAAGHACGPYRVPNVDVESLAVYTNNPPCGAMRGFGANQAAFGIESMMDMLAEKVGIDGWEMRWRNVLDVGDSFSTGQVLKKSVGIKKTLLAVKDAYRNAQYAGIACGIKNVGIGNGMPEGGQAHLVVEKDGTVTIYTGFTEMGQGLLTILVQCFCEVTGIDPRKVRVRVDTSKPVPCGMTTASRGSLLGGNAVKIAAKKLSKDLETATLSDLAGREYFGEFLDNDTTHLDDTTRPQRTHITYGFATQVVILDDEGRLKKVIAAHDVGRVLNPQLLEGQIEGSVHMGLGYALTEELRLENGAPQKYDLRSLHILRAKDMPEVEVVAIEETEPEGPFGAKGVGEIGLVPTAPAVAAALYRFDGIRRGSLPMKDTPAARAIIGKRKI
jgi:xanthine dehydrogenase molybdenum-binding subunit